MADKRNHRLRLSFVEGGRDGVDVVLDVGGIGAAAAFFDDGDDSARLVAGAEGVRADPVNAVCVCADEDGGEEPVGVKGGGDLGDGTGSGGPE